MGSEVTFIRRRGKIIPIRKKKKEKKDIKSAAIKSAGSAAILVGSAKASARMVEKSRPHFTKAAHIRGASKLAQSKAMKASLIKKAARSKIKGLRFQGRARGILGLGTFVASIFAGSAAGDIYKGDDISDEVAGFAAATVPFLGTLAFRKFGKVRFGGKDPKSAFRNIQKFGEKQSREVVRMFEKTKFKTGRVKKGTQMEFGFSEKKGGVHRFLKGF